MIPVSIIGTTPAWPVIIVIHNISAAAVPAAAMAPIVVSAPITVTSPVSVAIPAPVATGAISPVVVVIPIIITPVTIGAIAVIKSTTPYVDVGAVGVDVGVVVIIDDDVVVITTSNRPIPNLARQIPRPTGTPVGSVSESISVSSDWPIPNLTRKISSTTLTWSIQTRPTCTRKIPAAAAQSRAVWNLTGQCSCSTESGAVNSTTTQSGPIPNLTGECCGTASAGVGSIHPNLPTPRSIADLSGKGRGSTRSWAIKPTRADLTGKGIHAPKTRAGSILNLSGKSARTAGTNTAGDSP